MDKNKQVTCGIVVRVDGNKYLICRSTSSFDHKGREVWGFPKGQMEDGENYLDTAIRETHEETGLHLFDDRPEIELLHFYNSNKKTVVFFIIDLLSTQIDVNDLRCDSMVPNAEYPEIDKYLLVTKNNLDKYIHNHMSNVFEYL